MVLRKRITSLLWLCLLTGNIAYAEDHITLLYTAANPDWKLFETTYGYSLTGEYDFDNGLFISGFYNETDFRASGPEVGNVNVQDWTQAGIGYAFDHEWGHFYSLITFESIKAEHNTYEGSGAYFGYQKNFAENWTANVQFGYLDTEFHDFQMEGKLIYNISDNIAVTLGLRDYHDWDYTSYETGIRYQF